MNRALRTLRLVAVIAGISLVGGADWPADEIVRIVGGMVCC
jgi:hypothetical protein